MTDPRAFVRGLGTTAAVLGALAFVVGAPTRPQRAWHDTIVSAATRDALDGCVREDASSSRASEASRVSSRASEASRGICTSPANVISALQLAQWIRDGRPGLRVLDLRDSAAFETRHIPSAESFGLMELSSVLPRPDETLVVYSDDDLRDAQGAAWLAEAGHARVHVVRGGMRAWMTDVIDPVVQGDSAATVAALSRYFGGVPRAATPSADARDARAARTTPKAPVRNATDEVGFVARRGC
jgi:rhodanese-related sulfurtransferase